MRLDEAAKSDATTIVLDRPVTGGLAIMVEGEIIILGEMTIERFPPKRKWRSGKYAKPAFIADWLPHYHNCTRGARLGD